jgi:enoyl-CoA hydratase/carnithine racemase
LRNGPVLLEYVESVAWIRLNRPDHMNAMSADLVDALDSTLDEIDREGLARVLVITGNGPAFSAGGDLKAFLAQISAGEQHGLASGLRGMKRVLLRIEASSRPVIAAVNGVAIAGGLELILCCDIVLAAESAKLGDGHLRFGVVPGGGSSVRLPRKLPRNVANRLLLTGELVTAKQMAEWGLVNEVVPDDELERAASDLANRIASLSPAGLQSIKKSIANGADLPLERALEDEIEAFEAYSYSADFREGLAAFSEKRKPRFLGR